MARNEQHGTGHVESTVNAGVLTFTLHALKDEGTQSGIAIQIDATKKSLLEPIITDTGKEPSVADRLIDLVKKALREKGMTIIEEIGNAPPSPNSDPEAKQQSVAAFNSYKPGGKGASICGEKGYYPEKFDSATMLNEAQEILENIATRLRTVTTTEQIEHVVKTMHDAVEVYDATVEEAVQKVPLHSPSKAEEAEAEHKAMADAVTAKIPSNIATDESRETAATAIADGVLGTRDTAAWERSDSHASFSRVDPLRPKVLAVLEQNKIGKDDKMRAFFAGEVCDAIYASLNKGKGTGPT